MKLTRSSLKILIKECIIEVLSEGIGDESTLTSISENKQPSKKASVTPPKDRKKRSSHLDSIKFDKKVNNTAEAMTNDPVMQSILRQSQFQAERTRQRESPLQQILLKYLKVRPIGQSLPFQKIFDLSSITLFQAYI